MKPAIGSRMLVSLACLGIAGSALPAAAQEVLPWANAPLTTATDAAAAAPAGDTAAMEAAAAQCGGLFEASCRDLKTCAWVGDVALQDGTLVPARCVARPPAPPKKAAKKPATKPKEATAAAPKAEGAAPAVKASVTRSDSESGQAAATAAEPIPTPAQPPVAAKAAPEPKEDAPLAVAEPEVVKPKAQEKKAESAKLPIVVTPPSKSPATPAAGAQMPSFGSVTPVMPGGGNAIVVTVPPPE